MDDIPNVKATFKGPRHPTFSQLVAALLKDAAAPFWAVVDRLIDRFADDTSAGPALLDLFGLPPAVGPALDRLLAYGLTRNELKAVLFHLGEAATAAPSREFSKRQVDRERRGESLRAEWVRRRDETTRVLELVRFAGFRIVTTGGAAATPDQVLEALRRRLAEEARDTGQRAQLAFFRDPDTEPRPTQTNKHARWEHVSFALGSLLDIIAPKVGSKLAAGTLAAEMLNVCRVPALEAKDKKTGRSLGPSPWTGRRVVRRYNLYLSQR